MFGIRHISWEQAVFSVLVYLALANLLLYKIMSRVGIFIPKEEHIQILYNLLVNAGVFAGNLVMLMATALGAFLVVRIWGKGGTNPLVPITLFLLLGLTVWANLAGGHLNNMGSMLLTIVTLLFAGAVGWSIFSSKASSLELIWYVSIAGIIIFSLTSSFFTALGQNTGNTIWIDLGSVLFNAGQFALVASGFLILIICISKPDVAKDCSPVLILGKASAATAIFLFAYYIDPYTMSTLLQWSVGLNLVLPVFYYAVSLWCFIVGLGCLSAGTELGRCRSWGTMLLFAAGYHMPLTSDLLLAALGLVLIAFPGIFHAKQNESPFKGLTPNCVPHHTATSH